MGAPVAQNVAGHGPYCFRAQGQVYHLAPQLYPGSQESPRYGQLYVLDPDAAADVRMQNPQNAGCLQAVLRTIAGIFQSQNPFARSYKMMDEIVREQEALAQTNGNPRPQIFMDIRRDRQSDQRRYNLRTSNEIAMVFQNSDGEPPFNRDIRIYPRPSMNELSIRLNILSPNLDPMTYAIFYPDGYPGWRPNWKLERYMLDDIDSSHEDDADVVLPVRGRGLFRGRGRALLRGRRRGRGRGIIVNDDNDIDNPTLRARDNVSMLQFKIAQTAITAGEFNPIICGGKLFQQWCVDSYLQVEANNLNFIRFRQNKLRSDLYNGLMDHLNNAAANEGRSAGRAVILPSSFQNSPRNMNERYHDAMAIVGFLGDPDIFLTITCNPRWKEIIDNLLPGQTAVDRPDLICRVFKIKLEALMHYILNSRIFGRVLGWAYTIEFQKRGLPHAHILIILQNENKFRDAAAIDRVVCCELPDALSNPRLYDIVTRCMIHGPCGVLNPKSPCMENNKCTKRFPKSFQAETDPNINGYPLYKRSDREAVSINGKPVDNRWVVPFNPTLTLMFDCHINVEVCSSVACVKYLYKYIYKGYDCANLVVTADGSVEHNEVNHFVDTRYVSSYEGMWRLLENIMHDRSHAVTKLQIHLPNQQLVYFEEGNEEEAVEQAGQRNTNLTAYFQLNSEDAKACQYLYREIPFHYVYKKKDGVFKWCRRQRGANNVVPRMYVVSAKDIERFCLRLLLLNVRGATSFDNLKTVNGVLCGSFQDAARLLNLFADDQEWKRCLQEAANCQMPAQMRLTFAFILAFCIPLNALELWNFFKSSLSEDFAQRLSSDEAERHALHDIECVLKNHSMSLANFQLPDPGPLNINVNSDFDINTESVQAATLIPTLNVRQRAAFDAIMNAIDNPDEISRCFYLDGPGGSGKTYLYNTLMAFLRGRGQTVLPHATTGTAAVILKGGKTMHSGFKLPVPIVETSTSSMHMNSSEAENFRRAVLIIIDEASGMTTHALRCINLLLKEVQENSLPFGGKVIVLGGDFRQTLPVVVRGSRTEIVEVCLKSSTMWPQFHIFKLSENMRSHGQARFNQWVLELGEGKLQLDREDLPRDSFLVPADMIETRSITRSIFGNQINVHDSQLAKHVILTPKNAEALKINSEILNLLPGLPQTYTSADLCLSLLHGDEETNYPTEFLNAQTPSGMAPHQLTLKIGAIIMLIRNLDSKRGLCNGTRLTVKFMYTYFVDAEIISGSQIGSRVFIPRIELSPSDTVLPFILKRRQIPVIMAFAMTINKSQGQTFDKVGVYLEEPVFGHGRMYVAMSRCKNSTEIKVSIKHSAQQGALLNDEGVYTKNIVYDEVL